MAASSKSAMRQRVGEGVKQGALGPDDGSSSGSVTAGSKQSPQFPVGPFEGFAGTTQGSFFKPASWVDTSLSPGTTSQQEMYFENPNWSNILSGKFLIWSPNLVWLLIALAVYFIFPYDYGAAKNWDRYWIAQRATINTTLVLSYFGFWHFVLYGLGWASRPFVEDRQYRWSKVAHNMWYTILGALQWTIWEVVMIHLYATGRVGYQSDREAGSSVVGALKFAACFFWVPIFREIHFYFAHRFIHNKFMYKYVHSLHHRNTDVEPFSGLCMSPIEHLYYFSCIAPSLYVHASPFGFLWNGIHLLLSPAASHSGWEDHWQADQFHYAHHRYFECNYGTLTFPMDKWFGTFRETLAPVSQAYAGAAKGSTPAVSARADAKATLYGVPTWDHVAYMLATYAGIPLLVYTAASDGGGLLAQLDTLVPHASGAQLVAAVVAIGPCFVAAVLLLATTRRLRRVGLRYALLYPFHKETLLGSYGLNTFLSIILSILPVYHMVHALLAADPQQSIYHRIWG